MIARFLLRPRRPSLLRLALPGALALTLGASVLLSNDVATDEWPLFLLIVLAAILAPFIVFGLAGRAAREQWLEIRPRSLVLPPSAFSQEAIEVATTDVRSIFVRLTRDGVVFIETPFKNFSFPVRLFESPATAALFVDRVRESIRALPDGDDRILRIDREAQVAEVALSTHHAGTIGAAAVLACFGLVLYFSGGLANTFGMVRFGANVPFLVKEGEVHRLIASLFLHGSPIHLGFVIFGIASAGALVERLLGTVGALVTMLIAGLAGSCAMLASDGVLAVGATPVVFGLMGAAAFVTHHHRNRIPTLLRPSLGTWLMVGVFTLPVSLIPEVDFSANVGGLLGGVITGALVAGDRILPIRGLHPRGAVVALAAASAVYLVGLVMAGFAFESHDRRTDVRVMEAHVKLDRDTFLGFNKLAWEVAGDPESSARELELAEIAAQRAVQRTPSEIDSTLIEDTLATVLYRQGRLKEAIAIEKRVLERHSEVFIASQLARFLDRLAATTTSTHGVSAELSGGIIRARSEEPQPGVATIYAVVKSDDRVDGLIVFGLEPGDTDRSIPLADVGATWADGRKLVIGAVDRGKRSVPIAWKMDPGALELP